MTDTKLLGRPRVRVVFRDAPDGRAKSIETLAGKFPTRTTINIPGGESADVLVFTAQHDGSIHVISVEFIERVVMEQSDKYGDWFTIAEMAWMT